MKVLITGGLGYIGCVLTEKLLKNNYKVTIIDISSQIEFLKNYKHNKNLIFLKNDIRNINSFLSELKKSDIIIHLAGIVGYPACDKTPDLANEINVLSTKSICKNLSNSQILINSSTGSVYGNIKSICDETTECHPLTIYSKTKLEAEKIIQNRENSVSLRLATCFGPSPSHRFDLLINDLTYKALQKEKILLYQPNYMRTFIEISDIANAFYFTIQNFLKMKNQIFNVGDETNNVSKLDLIKKIKQFINFDFEINEFDADKDVRNYQVDYSKIKSLGYNTSVDLEKGIHNLIKFYEKI